ncbi:hypothetical protein ESCO_001357 [Escovopsis weberi]|uniref:DUF7136 domain-containing protein n=1 Tax=Escovopsis weberi TaxID=150374 RepID=A0A0M9VUC5_ESCWE|nr:hypothetical protein ESCO_001357 [Escovopsis weberi]
MPIVFALKNPELAGILKPSISFDVWGSNSTKNLGDRWYLRWANFSSSDPFFYYHGFTHYNTNDHWTIDWRFEWDSCVLKPYARGNMEIISNSTGGRVEFTTSKSVSGGVMDLIAALQDSSSCSSSGAMSPGGVAINITGTMQAGVDWRQTGGDTCAHVANKFSTLTLSQCGAKNDAAAATSIASWVTEKVCLATDAPLSCLSLESSGAQRLTVGSVACLAAALGGMAYLLRFF